MPELAGVYRFTPTGRIVTTAPPQSEEWFAARRGGITGTDLPKILGDSSYGNALSVWLEKRGELDDRGAGEAAYWGNVLEHPVAQHWASDNGTEVLPVGVLAHVDEDWMRASLDRIVRICPDGDGPCGLEVKTRSAFVADAWKEGIPDDVLAQVQWGTAVAGYEHMHVAALIGGQRFTQFRVDRDDAVVDYLRDAAWTVWTAVQDGVPPTVHPDAEGVLLALLNRIHDARKGAKPMDDNAELVWQYVTEYLDGGDLESQGKRMKEIAKGGLVQLIDDGDAGTVDDKLVFTYKPSGGGDSLPAAGLRKLKDEHPRTFRRLRAWGYIKNSDPSPRFDLKTRRRTITGAR